jgi:hypothetical protein
MPWTVRIVNEEGKRVSDGDVTLEFRVLDSLPAGARMLEGIDRYQDTTFNSQQLRLLLGEWDALLPQITDANDRVAWKQIRDYAGRCIREPHTYLKFIGD